MGESSKKWSQDGKNYNPVELSTIQNKLPKGVYAIVQNPMSGALYLSNIADEYAFDHKVYGTQTSFIEHVLRTFNHTTSGSTGVMLTGIKGTGKSVTAKQLANATELPIIICDTPYGNLSSFIDNIPQDIVVLFDEFEKTFDKNKGHDIPLLSLMDGTSVSKFRRMFLLTSNEMRINENMQNRPGRIRYLKEFGNLDKETIIEIVTDKLVNKDFIKSTVEFVKTLELITIDILSSICTEVNIHNVEASSFADIFNVRINKVKYTLRNISYGNEFINETAIANTLDIGNTIQMYCNYNDQYYYLRIIEDAKNTDTVKVCNIFESSQDAEDSDSTPIEIEHKKGKVYKTITIEQIERKAIHPSFFI